MALKPCGCVLELRMPRSRSEVGPPPRSAEAQMNSAALSGLEESQRLLEEKLEHLEKQRAATAHRERGVV